MPPLGIASSTTANLIYPPPPVGPRVVPCGSLTRALCGDPRALADANETELTYGPPTSPKGTGGGATPAAVAGVGFDLTNPWSWNKTKPVEVMPEPEEPDVRYVVTLGLQGTAK